MIDNFIVFGYLLIILIIGYYGKSSSASFKNYANVKGKLGKNNLILVAAIFSSSIGAGTTFGVSEKAYLGQIYFAIGLMFTIPIDLLIAIYVVPKITKHYGAESVGDIFSKYYGDIGRFMAGFAAIIISVGFLAAQINISGRIFQYILDIDHIYGIIISYSIVIIYTTIGGFRSILWTNLLQFFATIIAIPLITIIGLYNVGIDNFINNVTISRLNLNDNLLTETIFATLGFAVMGMYPNFIQRTLINNDHNKITKAIYIKSVIYMIFLICISINGLVAHILYPNQIPANAILYSIDHIIPTGIQGIVVIGLLSAAMSTADSDLNVTSITFVKDVFNPIFKIKNEKILLLIARIFNVVVGIFAIIISINFKSVVDLIIFITGFWCPVIVVPLIFALFGITITKAKMLFSSVFGCFAFLLWEYFFMEYFNLNLKSVFVGTIISILTFLVFILLKDYGKQVSKEV